MNENHKNLILLVADDREELRRAAEALAAAGFETTEASAEAILEDARRLCPVGVLLGERFRDDAERRDFEENLRRSEERYRMFVAQSSEGIWRFELTEPIPADLPPEQMVALAYERGYLGECNDAMVRMYGFEKQEDIKGAKLADLFVREDPANEAYLRSFFESGMRLIDAESHERDVAGNDKYFLNNLVGFVENGFFVRAWGTQRDITWQKRAEAELLASREQYRTLFDSIDEGFGVIEMIFDDAGAPVDYRFLETNPSFEKQTGIAAERLRGKTVLEVLPDLERYWIETYGRIALSGVPERFVSGSEAVGRWFDVYAFRTGAPEQKRVALLFNDITERRRVELALRESEARFRNMADNAPVMVWVTEADGYCTYLSQSWYKFTGQTPEEALGLGWTQALHPDDRRIAEETFIKSNEKREAFSVEYRFRRADGEYRWAIDSAQPRFAESGAYLGYVGSVVDIHERRTAEEKIRRSEATLRAFYDSSTLLTGVVELGEENEDILHVYDNEASNRFFNLPVGSTAHRRATEMGATPEIIRVWTEKYRESERLARPANFEYEHVQNGERRMLSVTVSCLGAAEGGGDGARTRFSYVAEDVTERRLAQEKFIAAERRAAALYQELLARIVPLAQTLGAARDLSSVYRAIGEFVRSSMPCCAFFVSFYDAENNLRAAAYAWGEEGEIDITELPPMPIAEGGGPNSQAILSRRPVVTDDYMETIKNLPHVIVGDNGRHPKSSLVVPMIVMSRVIGTLDVQAHEQEAFGAEQTIALEMVANLAAVAIENVRLLEAEGELRREAENATRAKDEFITIISHELRSPLNAILGWTRILQNDVTGSVNLASALDIIVRNARAQSKLIEDLLDTARIRSGKLKLEMRRTNPAEAVASAVETAKPAAAAKDIRLEISAEPAVGEVEGDPDRLRQIFENLLSNALKFTPSGGSVEVKVERDVERVKITVTDSGQGISPEFLPFIFERFRQADPASKRRHGGLGIGLALTKQLVEMHGGTIVAESAGSGQGSTFAVCLPVATAGSAA